MNLQQKINEAFTKQNFITWLKNQDEDFVYNENHSKENSLCMFGQFQGLPVGIDVLFETINIPNEVGNFDEYNLPEWVSEFSDGIFDYYYQEVSSTCNVSVRQLLMYFGEA